ncbi:carbonic anhydrase [Auricularia subglabra TFB-10046 SS5]|uniref:Carbonic anhydrase n=1 Tax=Auricularia subglabra (strain TFB-10046 / SS5) TaxID=717982 RepID=J0LC58_AURST|nr:carbonic anhydrase [Auricularia subglabra TFB-10046 SS5]
MFSTLVTAVAVVGAAPASCVHRISPHRRQEGTVDVSNFGYSGEIQLGRHRPGQRRVPQLEGAIAHRARRLELGTTLETIVNGTTVFECATFELKQFHLHTPSEHRVNKEYFPLEMHMVHEVADAVIAVIAIPFQLTEDGSTTALLTSGIENIAQVTTPGTATKTGALDFAAVTAGPLFQYTDSLTTTPCAEGLTFLVLEKLLPLDVKTFNPLKSVIKFNARYSQNTFGRTNLLDVAVALAVQENGLNLAGGAAAAGQVNSTQIERQAQARQQQHDVQIASDVDAQALVRELVNAGQEMRLETGDNNLSNNRNGNQHKRIVVKQQGQ